MLIAGCCVAADFGVDTSTWTHAWPRQNLSCLHSAGKEFIVIEGYRTKNASYDVVPGHIVPTAAETIGNARSAGFDDVHVYHFPDTNQDPSDQIILTLDHFFSDNYSSTKLWLDVEGPQFWSLDCRKNADFLAAMVKTAQSRVGVSRVGIYSSMSQWQPIMCGNTTFSDIPLWRAHYDGKPNNSDWDKPGIGPFGGWETDTIAMKQYNGTTSQCGMAVDLDWQF